MTKRHKKQRMSTPLMEAAMAEERNKPEPKYGWKTVGIDLNKTTPRTLKQRLLDASKEAVQLSQENADLRNTLVGRDEAASQMRRQILELKLLVAQKQVVIEQQRLNKFMRGLEMNDARAKLELVEG